MKQIVLKKVASDNKKQLDMVRDCVEQVERKLDRKLSDRERDAVSDYVMDECNGTVTPDDVDKITDWVDVLSVVDGDETIKGGDIIE